MIDVVIIDDYLIVLDEKGHFCGTLKGDRMRERVQQLMERGYTVAVWNKREGLLEDTGI